MRQTSKVSETFEVSPFPKLKQFIKFDLQYEVRTFRAN